MKVRNSKLFFMMSLCVGLFLTSSCQKEVLEETTVSETPEKIDNEVMPKGRYMADLHVSDPSNPASSMVISVSTNSTQIYDQFVDENFQISTLRLDNIENYENDEDMSVPSIDYELAIPNVDEHFISISVREENHAEEEVLKITLGDELLAVIKDLKAKTHVEISSPESAGRYSVNRNYFWAFGDGGVKKTRLSIQYQYFNGLTYTKETPYGFYNSYKFESCQWPSYTLTRCRYIHFTVTYDVLSSWVRGTTSSCHSCNVGWN